ncbi:MAG: phosphoribosylaminoimidazolesuccinocarboxamide synthase [Candidatus Aenigmatarchaeota archaeon]|nr:MAG: phosphoribosylaminoimidazolesuccinocarboxamide synthase [Candidatus Aenigmarchaeota archaeon]
MGSVKNLIVTKKPTENSFGLGVFEFTDDYSVFDFGKMPDRIQGKGESLCRIGSWNFQKIKEELGLKTHFKRFIEPNKMEINLVRKLVPGRDEINIETTNYLIPLEIIFRNSLPPGSSVFKALDSGELTPEDIGLETRPEPGQRLEKPFLDVTTKLEVSDRRLKWDEAQKISGLTDEELEEVKRLALRINEFITKRADAVGLEHADGKIELAIGPEREILVVDVFGTPDENRFLYDGFHISKQVLRDFYRKTPWVEQLENAKKILPKSMWPKPENLPDELVSAVSNMYKAVCELWTGKKIWNVSLNEAIETIKKFV